MYNSYFQNRENEMMNNRSYNADGNRYFNVYGNNNDNFYQGDGYYAADANSGMMQMGADQSQPYIIQVANSTTNNVTAVVFDANVNLLPTATNYGNSAAVTITMQNGNLTYGQFLGQLREKPFRISQIYQFSSNTSQPFQALSFTTFDTFGASTNYSRAPILNPFQNQSGASILDYPFTVDGNTKLSFTLLASATTTFQFYPNKVYNISHGLAGRPVNMMLGNPKIAGVPYLAPSPAGVSTPMIPIGRM